MNSSPVHSLGAKLGPGILFAAASVGVSHLVQSTRAGADFGLAMGSLILLICVLKYPSFRFGLEYAAATGNSLIDAYFKQGPWAVIILALAGWMPAPLGVAVFQSFRVCAKSKDMKTPFSPSDALFDFNLGYGLTAILALGFLILGTVLMYQPGIEVANTSVGLGAQLMSLFAGAIGDFAFPIIAFMAVAVVLSSLLTMIDACPRGIGILISYGARKRSAPVDAGVDNGSQYCIGGR